MSKNRTFTFRKKNSQPTAKEQKIKRNQFPSCEKVWICICVVFCPHWQQLMADDSYQMTLTTPGWCHYNKNHALCFPSLLTCWRAGMCFQLFITFPISRRHGNCKPVWGLHTHMHINGWFIWLCVWNVGGSSSTWWKPTWSWGEHAKCTFKGNQKPVSVALSRVTDTARQPPQEKNPCIPWNNFRNKDLKQEACEQILAAFSLLDI